MGDDDRSDEELAAQQQVLAAFKRHTQGEGNAEETVNAFKNLLATRGQRQGVDEERNKTLAGAIEAMGRAMALGVPPDSPPEEPMNDSERMLRSLGLKPSKQLRAELDALTAARDQMRRVMADFAGVMKDTRRSTKLPEALPYLQRLDAALASTILEGQRPGGVSASRFHEAHLVLGDVHRDLQRLESVDALDRLRSDRLYPSLAAIRRVLMEGHAMVAHPRLGRVTGQPTANHVCFLGTPSRRSALEPNLRRLGLMSPNPRRGSDEATNRWQDMLDGELVICDLFDCTPVDRAAICYQLGWARALGRPVVMLTGPDDRLPFNVDVQPTDAADAQAIDDAILGVLFEPSTAGLVRAASRNTVAELRRRYDGHPDAYVRGQLEMLIKETENGAHDGVIYDRIRSLVAADPAAELDVITPTWPPSYPIAGTTRMFHVMPYVEGWSDDVSLAAERGAGGAYRIHKRVEDDHIIRSMWDEIAAASHLLVDVTALNDNVMIELGMAHVLGKETRMVVQAPMTAADLPAVLRRRQVTPYDPKRLETLTDVVKRFLRRVV